MVEQRGALPPQKLSLYMLNVYRALFAFGFGGMVVGICGLAVLLDGESKSLWYSKTEFAAYWRDLTESYPMMTNICVNGGVIAMIVSFLRLQSHGKAVALEESAEGKKKK